MADVTKPVRRGRNRTKQEVEERAPDLDAEETSDESQDEQGGGGADQRSTVTSEIKDTIRDAAIEVLRPVAKKATTSAAKYAVTRGPDLVKDKVLPMVEDAGGAGALAKGALSKGGGSLGGLGSLAGGVVGKVAGGGGGGKKPTGHGRGRRLPVQEFVDVAVDIETAYDQFTQFEDFPQFMHRVEKIEQRDDTTLMWHENIWGVRRSWEAEIVEQKPCERIVWRSKGQTQTVGVITFHRLSDKLTRIYVNLDFQPKGLFEKTASGMRMSRRALRSDLMRFKAFVEMRDESTGAWRGVIEDGEVTEPDDSGDEGTEDTEARGDEDEEEFEDEPAEEEPEDEEPRAEEDEEYEDEEPEEDEEEPRGRGRFARDEDEEEEPEEEEEEEVEEKPKRAPRRSRSSSSSSTRKPRTRARRG